RLHRLLGLPGVLALEMGGGSDFHRVVVDVEIGHHLGLPLDHDGVVARVLEGGPEEAVGLRRGGAVGLRPARDDSKPARAPYGQAGEGAGSQDEAIVGMIPVDPGTHFLVEDLGAQTDTAQILAHVLRPGLRPDLSRGEVDAQELARIAGNGCGCRFGLLGGTCGGGERAHWTITWWGSRGDWEGRPRIV